LQVTNEIYREVVEKGFEINSSDARLIKNFVEKEDIVIKPLNEKYERFSKELVILYPQLDKGKCEIISLCLQENEGVLAIDEHEGRLVTKLYKIRPIGSLRILLESYKKNILNEKELSETLDEMLKNKFRLSGDVINEFWNIFEKIKGRKNG